MKKTPEEIRAWTESVATILAVLGIIAIWILGTLKAVGVL